MNKTDKWKIWLDTIGIKDSWVVFDKSKYIIHRPFLPTKMHMRLLSFEIGYIDGHWNSENINIPHGHFIDGLFIGIKFYYKNTLEKNKNKSRILFKMCSLYMWEYNRYVDNKQTWQSQGINVINVIFFGTNLMIFSVLLVKQEDALETKNGKFYELERCKYFLGIILQNFHKKPWRKDE